MRASSVALVFRVACLCCASAAAVVATLDAIDEDSPPPVRAPTLTGQLLIAAPDLDDETFAGARIYLVHHDGNGAVGVVVNGPVLGAAYGVPYAWGGPVGARSVLVLHDGDVGNGAAVEDGVVVSGHDPALLQALVHRRGPDHARSFVGYAGWGPGQLERELAAGAWSVVDVNAVELFSN